MYEQGNLDTIWCVIPVYNNGQTIRSIALECREQLTNVLVIDDGSTDVDLISLLSDTDITIVRHQVNQGKGKALLTALDYVAEKDARYMITVDGDGQHQASDLEGFFSLIENDEDSFVIGCRDFTGPEIPNRSKFGRKVANFWLSVETGVSIRDCQSGFRAYPVKHFQKLKFCGTYYDFETEALARAAWAGLNLKMVEIGVLYPEKEKRISSFRPFVDNFRISVMHSRLVLRRMLPMPHKKLVSKKEDKIDFRFFLHPIQFLKKLLKENATPAGLAASAVVGIILATLPLLFTHTIAIIYVTMRFHLNKVMALSIQNLCMPPLVPFVCIELGYFMQNGKWLVHVSKEAFVGQAPGLLWCWFIGSLAFAPFLALTVGTVVYFISNFIQKKEESRRIIHENS